MKMCWSLRKLAGSNVRRLMRAVGFRGEEGGALVEFAVTLPLFLTVLTGTASFSLGLYFVQQIGNATSSAAMSLGGEAGLFPNNDPCAAAKSFVTGALPNLAPSKLTLKLVLTDTNLGTDTYNGTGSTFSCSTAPAMEANYPVTLTVTYSYQWMPILKFSPSSSLSSTQAAIQE
jgi:Flp pilus assembly protein TadG